MSTETDLNEKPKRKKFLAKKQKEQSTETDLNEKPKRKKFLTKKQKEQSTETDLNEKPKRRKFLARKQKEQSTETDLNEKPKRKKFLTKKQKRVLIKEVIMHLILITLSLLFVFPFLWMLFTALKTPQELIKGTAVFFPKDAQWQNFKIAITTVPFFMYLKNSLIIVVFGVIGTLFSATVTAYAFAKLKWPGRDTFFIIMLATMMIPMQVILIPTYIMYSKIGWLGTRLPLIVPYFFGGGAAFYIFMLRQFFKGIPNELTESAIVDGANHFQIFGKIMLPLCKPALITVALFTFMLLWNDYFGPLIYLSDPEQWTLALGLRSFQSQFTRRFDLQMAASILVMLPTLVIFFFAQKQFIEGITFSGIKG